MMPRPERTPERQIVATLYEDGGPALWEALREVLEVYSNTLRDGVEGPGRAPGQLGLLQHRVGDD